MRHPCSKSPKPGSANSDGRWPSEVSASKGGLGIGEHCYSPWTIWGLPLLPFLLNCSLKHHQAESRAVADPFEFIQHYMSMPCPPFCRMRSNKEKGTFCHIQEAQ